jgi:Transposase domain (DUF772)
VKTSIPALVANSPGEAHPGVAAGVLLHSFQALADGAFDYNLLFRWFVGLNTDDPVWVPTVFTHNRDRLLEGEAFNPLDTPS